MEDTGFVKTVPAQKRIAVYRVGSDCSVRKRKKHQKYMKDLPSPQCDEGDIVIDGGECPDGSEFLICGQITPGICPMIGGEEGTVVAVEVTDQTSVTCAYSKNVLTSETAIDDYILAFGFDEDFDLILGEACFLTTENCPIDPLTGKKMPLCSRYVSPDSSGLICRQQALLPSNQAHFKSLMEQYCRTETTPDCRCIDRTNTLVYDSLRSGLATEDGCWWKSCANATDFLVPPDIVLGTYPQRCPDVLKKVANKINNNVDTIECCQIQQNVIYAPDGNTKLPVNCFFTDAVLLQESWAHQFGWWILILIVVFIVILGVAIVWASHAYHTERYVS